MEFKASDLVQSTNLNSRTKLRNYEIELQKCLETIKTTFKATQTDHIFYKIPIVLANDPNYDYNECVKYIKEKLTKLEFYVRIRTSGNELFISWNPEDVEKVKRKNLKVNQKIMQKDKECYIKSKTGLMPAMSRLNLTTNLMRHNPAYSKLFTESRNVKRSQI